ncbi:Phosphoglycolate phosphatase [Stieleria neptunia]|uniref:Phosphoglycolate phosphatase n=1 Tax=Stieleria neptunia TaxID=2527979 RepID=A0A518HQ50_9BACT|nr:TIGR01459 family HAD-type hydrolase [Stieleria neptunia]QDV42970.1 Phosphoglycolate phosphatase [Stieleria neptunia]
MTQFIDTLREVLAEFDVAVLDQWGVLHDGTTPYSHAIEAIGMLADHGKEMIVVSNSGKRSELNRARMQRIGLPMDRIGEVVTSGEALWDDIRNGRLTVHGTVPKTLFPICATFRDAIDWGAGCERIELRDTFDESVDAILLMGLSDEAREDDYDGVFDKALADGIPVICSNPDKSSPRAGGLVISPGHLADRFCTMGGEVLWYGKPHAAIYNAVQRAFPDVRPDRFLMVGDSLEHDIGGAQNIGFASALVRSGVHRNDFAKARGNRERRKVIDNLSARMGVIPPTFCLDCFA